jgi:beta-glucanase (GH16 family)
MLIDSRTSGPNSPPGKRKPRTSRRRTAVVSCAVAAAVAAAAVVVAVKHEDKSSVIPPKAIELRVPPVEPPSSWKLNFDSSFTGSSLDTSVFGTCYPWSAGGEGCTNYGNSGDEDQEWYMPSQVQVSGGVLNLLAQREPTPGLSKSGAPKEYQCRSGMVTTFPGFKFEYGYVQIVAKIPFDNGLWPALWLAAANEKWPPEVDILEHWATDPQGKVYLHPLTGARQGGPVDMPNLSKGYHTFTLKWTATQLIWYYDGNQVFSTATGVPHQSMYLVADLADDIVTPGTCSGSMSIKSIKVWQP